LGVTATSGPSCGETVHRLLSRSGTAPLHTPLRKRGIGGVWDDATPVLSPYVTNPFAMAPLAQALHGVVDVEALRSAGAQALYVNAVSARTGLSRVFGPACLALPSCPDYRRPGRRQGAPRLHRCRGSCSASLLRRLLRRQVCRIVARNARHAASDSIATRRANSTDSR
jgi:hypothetical protein